MTSSKNKTEAKHFLRVWVLLLPVLSLFALTNAASAAAALADDDDPPLLSLWRGGLLNIDFRYNLNATGAGYGSAMMGGILSAGVGHNAAIIFNNPAGLGFIQNRDFVFDTQLGYGSWTTSSIENNIISSFNDEIETETDNFVRDPDNFILSASPTIRPTQINSLRAGVGSGFTSFAVAWPVYRNVVLGLGATQPADIRFRLQSSGLSTKIREEQGTDDVSVRFDILMNISSLLDFSFQMQNFTVGLGALLYSGELGDVAGGFALNRYTTAHRRILSTDLNGFVVVGGADERFFNNPNDPNLNFAAGESNDFVMQASGDFQDTRNGFQFSASWKTPWFADISLSYNHMPEFSLTDPNSFSRAFLPVFIVGQDVLSGDLELELDSLQANKPNLSTERDISDLISDSRLQLPSSLRLGVDLKAGRHTIVLNYIAYTSPLRLEFGDDIIGKSAGSGFGLGANFVFPEKLKGWNLALIPVRLLFLDIDGLLFQAFSQYTRYSNPNYSFGASVMFSGALAESTDEDFKDLFDNPTPTSFSMGRWYSVFDDFTVGVNIAAFPDLFFRASVGYRF
ncbi:hypothetical protein CYPRO_2277 [Cyclonatronum proteinivorum]|uniref:DUF5723 domain-containing protein n=1 Tax=Cyclonatronum proteinivorum TaxID=1457365 RepID=A0A345UM21_9BACT|nr:hypothetical protein [Cyclonatronum proteinivorum]AXJ01523.1 hypothetical protein CYPRO_2277 [Cyclonatronum proteinivorum]